MSEDPPRYGNPIFETAADPLGQWLRVFYAGRVRGAQLAWDATPTEIADTLRALADCIASTKRPTIWESRNKVADPIIEAALKALNDGADMVQRYGNGENVVASGKAGDVLYRFERRAQTGEVTIAAIRYPDDPSST